LRLTPFPHPPTLEKCNCFSRDSIQSIEWVFEFDSAKSESNREKHGIDFQEARHLWDGFVIEAPLPFDSESRFVITGQIRKKHYSAINTFRHEKIRIISVRRARKEEIARWHHHQSRR